ncbi:MAG: sigma-54-dependent Fis family transcriptional regulator, partial [Myxococcales bacterium]|nr:sigma-54-dependent Fis family transcriptional regulator [Myxococcales bacterium]
GVVVQDMNFARGTTSGVEGAELFARLRELDPQLPIILITAWASLETAVSLVKQGADDYIEKPWDDALLLRKVKNLLNARARAAARIDDADLCGLLFASAPMNALVRLALKVAATDLSALVTGPNGAGKEKVAEIVQANSARRGAPFVKVNVGALPDELFAAELFGAEAGAFTGAKQRRVGRFEAAHGGTLFLDEIGTLSMDSQAKLLRTLQSGELERLGSNRTLTVDVRVIAATNEDLPRAIREKRFREDLYYRLAVIELAVPPLAARPDDVMPLARAFAQMHGAATFSDASVRALEAHTWPGNVRELQNRVQRALLMSPNAVLEPEHFGLDAGVSESAPVPSTIGGGDEERVAMEQALARADFVVADAARALGMSRQAFYRRMKRLGIRVSRDVSSDD